jgi:4-hydroxybenzoate polyprenyltransferase
MSAVTAPSLMHVTRAIAADIKMAHSIFALPFAVLAAFMAAAAPTLHWPRFGGQLALIAVAMITARTVAMLANRWLDRQIDRDNPRTAGRALPSGRVRTRDLAMAGGGAAILFIATCATFGALWGNWWPLILALPVLAWISAYALLKRFTSLCHLYLGVSLGISPLAAALAIEPAALVSMPALWLLAGMVVCWVAGFDVIYALQDIEVDRRQKLFSIPGRWGVARAMLVSRTLHAIAVGLLVAGDFQAPPRRSP